MKLSEAMMLGDSMRKRDSFVWLDRNGKCGCAMGGAALAAGGTFRDFMATETHEWFQTFWPWIEEAHTTEISGLFLDVCSDAMTFEQLVDYVRSIEPDCGVCCRFECSCTPEEKALEVGEPEREVV